MDNLKDVQVSYRLRRDFPFILYDILFKLNFVLHKHDINYASQNSKFG